MTSRPRLLSIVLISLLASLITGCAGSGSNAPQAQFDTPNAAADALVSALRSDNTAELTSIFGAGDADLLNSGDPVADRAERDAFVTKYDTQHSLAASSFDSVTIVAGLTDWPMPIPIVKNPSTGKWSFDTAAGKQELINRRVGRNELSTIQTCLAVVDAQREYANMDADGNGMREFAVRFISSPGKKDGLYWPTEPGQPQSPLGLLVSQASNEGYVPNTGDPEGRRPFRGYFYRMLTSQGNYAPDGARDYVLGGMMIGGFAVIAWPAEYGNSGVMTFMVNQDGIVYERDIGSDTQNYATTIPAYNPGPEWRQSSTEDPTQNP